MVNILVLQKMIKIQSNGYLINHLQNLQLRINIKLLFNRQAKTTIIDQCHIHL
jgi:hypothetical protein